MQWTTQDISYPLYSFMPNCIILHIVVECRTPLHLPNSSDQEKKENIGCGSLLRQAGLPMWIPTV